MAAGPLPTTRHESPVTLLQASLEPALSPRLTGAAVADRLQPGISGRSNDSSAALIAHRACPLERELDDCHISFLSLPPPALRRRFDAGRRLPDRCVSDTPSGIFSENVKKLLIPGTAIL